MAVPETEVAWAAGFFDGEGCFSVRRDRRGYCGPHMIISQTDEGVLERFAAAVEGGTIRARRAGTLSPLSKKPQWTWYVQSRQEVLRCATAIWPYLSPPKKRDALAMFEERGMETPDGAIPQRLI